MGKKCTSGYGFVILLSDMNPFEIIRKLAYKVFFVLMVFFTMMPAGVNGASFVKREELDFDQKLSDQSNNEYAYVSSVSIARVSPPSGLQFGDSKEWLNGWYYYSITKMGFADIPFNYLVTWDGASYQGKSGGNDVLPIVNWVDSDDIGPSILVVYFDNNREFTNAGRGALVDTLSDVLTLYGLSQKDVIAVDVTLSEKSDQVSLSSLVLKKSADREWNNIVGSVSGELNIGRRERDYSGEVGSIVNPTSVDAGKNFVVTAEVKNSGEFPWYNSGESAVYVATSSPRNKKSKFFVSDKWASFSRVTTSEEKTVLPGQVATFKFEMKTPLIPGEYSEKFELISLSEGWISGTGFTVKFSVSKGNLDLVEVLDTETGSLNVRSCPSTKCKELGKVVPGDILVKLGTSNNWYKIQWEEDEEGWVYGKYIKPL